MFEFIVVCCETAYTWFTWREMQMQKQVTEAAAGATPEVLFKIDIIFLSLHLAFVVGRIDDKQAVKTCKGVSTAAAAVVTADRCTLAV